MTAIGPAYKVYADDPEPANDSLLQQVEAAIASVSQAVLGTANLDDWQAAGLSAAGKAIPSKYSSALYKKLAANHGTFTSATDYERTVIGMTAAHQDATKFAGYNLVEQIYSYPAISTLNGLDFALLALDSGHYAVPDNAVWTREKLVEAVLSKVNPDGGFNWTPSASDPDMTGMTLTALAPYAGQSAVQPASHIVRAA
ncbi:hypothetical protein GZH47_02555 [Paenibacillus rhizovicinus]|uniref:Terpene cyclase/mutase family protein n=1 Tax=Paenibacillus rhizovicinus TaxID=2704463 RepID=A0A6C0NVR0_9BACL|nr:hypothetical protein [Paenibacillus rhizovicinus]QHW29823.1 hypothetical protein GZH47_02555 [Paenibacillus rhizovicinus]